MNTPTQPTDQDKRPQIDQRRRSLAKGALAAPVVLGTLMSRPVLGAAPYHCTISGQISGNISPRPGANTRCDTLGRSPGFWGNRGGANRNEWPPFSPDALFSSVFANAYPERTLLQVLQTGGGMTQHNNYPALGRAAVASYLNAYHMLNYPLTQMRVVAMFNAVYNGGSYQVSATVFWNAADVMRYFESLYQPV